MSTEPWGFALLALILAGAAPPECGPRGEAPDPPGVEVIRDVEFGVGGGRPLRMHILRPANSPQGPLPVVVWIHGGGWSSGDHQTGFQMLPHLVRRGYLGVSIEYRLSGEASFPAQIEDCKCAIRFLRAHASDYQVDPERIGVWGGSAGGHLAALLGTSAGVADLEGQGGWPEQSSRVQAVCDWFGPTDFLKMNDGGSRLNHEAADSPESLLIGGPIRESPDQVARANPITYVDPADPPFLIMHGDRDELVPPDQSRRLVRALERAGVPVELVIVEGKGHGFGGAAIDRQVREFFDQHLK